MSSLRARLELIDASNGSTERKERISGNFIFISYDLSANGMLLAADNVRTGT